MDFPPPDNSEMAAGSLSSLISAAREGDLERVKELIAAGASLDAHDNDGFSALPIAALCGHEHVVRHLLDAGANPGIIHVDFAAVEWRIGWPTMAALLRVGRGVNQPVLESMTPMEWAASKGNVRLLKALLFCGTTMDAHHLEAALRLAARGGRLNIVEILIQRKVSINVQDPKCKSALAEAAENGHLDVVKTLLAAGATLNHPHWPPLTLAAAKGHTSIITLLLSVDKTCINALDHDSMTALARAVEFNRVEAAQVLIEAGADISPSSNLKANYDLLSTAAQFESPKMTEVLLAAKANPNVYTITPPLSVACIGANADIVKTLLVARANTEAKDAQQMTTMSHAVRHCRLDIIKTLAKAGADVNVLIPKEGMLYLIQHTPLTLAAEYGDTEAIKILVEVGALVDAKNGDGLFALGLAAREGHLDCVKALLTARAMINLCDEEGTTAVMEAVNSGCVDILEELIAAGADIHARDNMGRTALLLADTADVAQVLLAARADVNVCDTNTCTPLLRAVETRDIEYVETILKADAKMNGGCQPWMSPLLQVFSNRLIPANVDILKLLLDKGADASAVNSDGDGALHLLAFQRNIDIRVAELLLNAGASVNLQNQRGKTALMYAIQNDALALASLLLSRRADVNLRDNEGKTALLDAVSIGSVEAVRMLLTPGSKCQVDTQYPNGETPLMAAVQAKARDIVKLLLDAQANVNLVDSTNATALQYALRKGDVDTLKLLVAAGAQPEIGYPAHDSPLFKALFSHKSEIRDVLLEAKAHIDMSKLTKYDTKPLERIIVPWNRQILEKLLIAGLDLSESTNLSGVAIHTACWRNDENILRLLVQAGARIDADDPSRPHITSVMAAAASPRLLKYVLETFCHQIGYLVPLENLPDLSESENAWVSPPLPLIGGPVPYWPAFVAGNGVFAGVNDFPVRWHQQRHHMVRRPFDNFDESDDSSDD